jgi:CheY-like chemotaxis protein
MTTKRKILLVEDEQPIVELYRMKFENDGYHVVIAQNGHEGLELIEQHKPHVVLLDILMPDMDGIQMLDELSRRKISHNPKIIILTNVPDELTQQKAQEYGVTDFYVKVQVTPTQVADRVAELLA